MTAALQTLRDAPIDPTDLTRLHARLIERARSADLLDVAYTVHTTPIGQLLLAATPRGLLRVAFEREGHDAVLDLIAARVSPRVLADPTPLTEAKRQLDEYFAGHRHSFDLALDRSLSSGFRREVQDHLATIAYGHTETYSEVATLLGRPRAARAVGSGCATNPLPLVLPCHRVLRSDGSLGGYAGGFAVKATLLDLEGAA
jgi:methylated-DNA-[protein]-cysteine S-methyltransferase